MTMNPTPALWRDGNRIDLLINGEEYYPRVFAAIRAAKTEVLVETFIIFEDPIGHELRDVLIDAAKRGVRVELCADGYGTADLSAAYVSALTGAGVRFHMFDPQPKWMGVRTNLWRRMHRKIVVVDEALAFVGGINFSLDHVREFGPESKQDYAVEVSGPIVKDIRELSLKLMAPHRRRLPIPWWLRRPRLRELAAMLPGAGTRIALVHRDNEAHRDDIERHYREAIRSAQREIIIANAYFFPGYRLLRDLRNASRRGVKVYLILQGNPDQPSVKFAASTLYHYLLRSGAEIHEYCERPLHGKVATVDDEWSTVGSSNLDPLSLFLNLEANLVIIDRAFNARLRAHLHELMVNSCKKIEVPQKRTLWSQLLSLVAFHLARRFPRWAGLSPGRRPSLVTLQPATAQKPLPAAAEFAQSESSGTR
jgi:cardiolipin synthase